jgi:hypothetical protein
MAPAFPPVRKAGRPKTVLTRSERDKRIRHLALLVGRKFKARAIASMAEVSRATLFSWRNELLAGRYPEPEAEVLRQLFEERRTKSAHFN